MAQKAEQLRYRLELGKVVEAGLILCVKVWPRQTEFVDVLTKSAEVLGGYLSVCHWTAFDSWTEMNLNCPWMYEDVGIKKEISSAVEGWNCHI